MTERLPQDLDAERVILCEAIHFPRSLAEIAHRVTASDFLHPANKLAYALIVDAWKRGHSLDVHSLGAAMTEAGRVPDPLWLADIAGTVPGSWQPHAETVIRRRAQRDLLDIARQLKGDALTPGLDPFDVADSLTARLMEIRAPVAGAPSDLWKLDEFIDVPEHESAPWVVDGLLRKGWRCVVVGTEGGGKRLRLDEPIPTPTGWTTMGDLRVGDAVLGRDGGPCQVVGLSETEPNPDAYAITFSDGARIECDAQHQWLTVDYQARQGLHVPAVRTTAEIRDSLHARDGHCLNHAVPVAAPLLLPDADLPIDPYTLGAWLGDGHTRIGQITCADPEIVDRIRSAGYTVTKLTGEYLWGVSRHDQRETLKAEARELVAAGMSTRGAERAVGLGRDSLHNEATMRMSRANGLTHELRMLGTLRDKHIPISYLRASYRQRVELLRGLMDTDGTIGRASPRCELTLTNRRLVDDAVELIRSLGVIPWVNESDAKWNGRVVGRRFRINFSSSFCPFHLPRKAERWRRPRTERSRYRYITAVEPVRPTPMRCIQVDSLDHTYLAGRAMVPTHNSLLFRQFAIAAAQGIHPLEFRLIPKVRTLLIDLENPADAIAKSCRSLRSVVQQEVYEPGRAWLWHRPGGIDLRSRATRSEFEAVLTACRPDLVTLGPLYKAYRRRGQESDEEATAEVQEVLDDLRTRYEFALLLEHHAPQMDGHGHRKLRPYGSSLWLRWPELGIAMQPPSEPGDRREVALERWRGDRMSNSWPKRLEQGPAWPWVAA